MKDDGRLKSLGVLLAMISVIVAFFAMFLKREPLVVQPTSGTHHTVPTGAPSSSSPATPASSPATPASSQAPAP